MTAITGFVHLQQFLTDLPNINGQGTDTPNFKWTWTDFPGLCSVAVCFANPVRYDKGLNLKPSIHHPGFATVVVNMTVTHRPTCQYSSMTKMGNIVPRIGIEPRYLGFQSSVQPLIHYITQAPWYHHYNHTHVTMQLLASDVSADYYNTYLKL